MNREAFLFDTHALIFWSGKSLVSDEFLRFFDQKAQEGALYVSSISFWETALLAKKEKIGISDVNHWKNELLTYTHLQLIDPSATEMIESTHLPDHHKDPFDRLLIVQAVNHDLALVTKDDLISRYDIKTFWIA